MPEMADSLTLRLFGACRAFQQRVAAELARELAARGRADIGPAQLGFLAVLDCGAANHGAEIARRLGVSRQAVQKQLRELVAGGVLAKGPDPARGNQNVITFTADGVALMAQCRAILAEMDAGLAAGLAEAEVARVVALLSGPQRDA